MLSVLGVMAVLAPWITPQDPLAQSRPDRFLPPSLAHPFGTDEFGRDILSRVIHGARISLLTGAVAVLIGGTVGVPLGLLGGFAGGLTDAAIMRVLDFLLAVPAILLAMVIIAILGPGSFNAMLAVGVVSIPSFARLTRASTLTLKEREFVVATRALGVGPAYLMFRTILLNALTPIVVQVAVTAAVAMLLEAALSFLGLGTQPPAPSWGSMLNTGRSFLHQAPWYGLFPGVVITLSVLSLNALADTLQTVVDRGGAGRAARRGAGGLMARYVLFRLIQLLPVLLLASVGVWLMIYLIPGDPAIALLGADATPEQLARARVLMGLDRPLPVQYALLARPGRPRRPRRLVSQRPAGDHDAGAAHPGDAPADGGLARRGARHRRAARRRLGGAPAVVDRPRGSRATMPSRWPSRRSGSASSWSSASGSGSAGSRRRGSCRSGRSRRARSAS